MDFTIFLEYTFSQFQDKNISLTVRKIKGSEERAHIQAWVLSATALEFRD